MLDCLSNGVMILKLIYPFSYEREKQGTSYIPIFMKPEITINKINIVGNYAISIHWNDGHNTGIYEFTYLLELASTNEKLLKT